MDKYIVAGVIRDDKSVSFGRIEPFDDAPNREALTVGIDGVVKRSLSGFSHSSTPKEVTPPLERAYASSVLSLSPSRRDQNN